MLLSIITVNLNNAEGLKKTIDSIISQTSHEFEWIVVDGNSTDGSKELIEQYSDRFAWWCSEKDSGIYNAMNKGVAHATGDYCLFLNSGDVLHSSTSIGDLIKSSIDDNSDFIIGKTLFSQYGTISDIPDHISMNWFYKYSIPHPSTLIRTVLLRRNPYDESLKIVSDWKFFMQEIVLNNASYSFADVLVTDFDCGGISSNTDACNLEREKVLSELFPKRVLDDYEMFRKSDYYYNTNYDRFFMELRRHRASKLIYFFDVLLIKIVSIFCKGHRFVKKYSPIHFD